MDLVSERPFLTRHKVDSPAKLFKNGIPMRITGVSGGPLRIVARVAEKR